jgi:hypothetical protein
VETLTHYFQNRSLSGLCGIDSVSSSIGVNCYRFSEEEKRRLETRISDLVQRRLSEAGIQYSVVGDVQPRLFVGIASRPAVTACRTMWFLCYRVELSLREWLPLVRSASEMVQADIWRQRSTVNSTSNTLSNAEFCSAILNEVDRQVTELRDSLLLARVIETATSHSSRLPKIALLFEKFPSGTVEEVADIIGGRVGANIRDPNQPEYKNTCAIRVSRALNYAGAPIDRTIFGVRTNTGGDNKSYVYAVRDMKVYLTEKYGRPETKPANATAADFAGEKGIIAFGNFHVDLWNDTSAAGQSYFGDPNVRDPILLWSAR